MNARRAPTRLDEVEDRPLQRRDTLGVAGQVVARPGEQLVEDGGEQEERDSPEMIAAWTERAPAVITSTSHTSPK